MIVGEVHLESVEVSEETHLLELLARTQRPVMQMAALAQEALRRIPEPCTVVMNNANGRLLIIRESDAGLADVLAAVAVLTKGGELAPASLATPRSNWVNAFEGIYPLSGPTASILVALPPVFTPITISQRLLAVQHPAIVVLSQSANRVVHWIGEFEDVEAVNPASLVPNATHFRLEAE